MHWRSVAIVLAGSAAAALAQESVRESTGGPGVAMSESPDGLIERGLDGFEPAARSALAPVLAGLIEQSRDDAIARGVGEIPAPIRAAFDGFVPAQVLAQVRWRVDGETGLAGRLLFQSGAARALTLDNVILFASAEEAANVKLWAHELYHVMQYRQWGIDGFAERFVDDHRTLEHDAREFRWSWMKATGRVPRV